ncbi:MAG: TrkH family potassium uptake protein [Planctomycetota bacterium]|jgi:trk system potassium uptake protein TrkH
MNLAQVARILTGFTLFFSIIQGLMIIYALFEEGVAADISPVLGFGVGAGVGLAVSGLLWFAGRGAEPDFFRREGLAVVGLAWLFAGVLGAVPLYWSGAFTGGADALFESVSGLTTTGATVCGSGNNIHAIDELPQSILLWRSLLQWMGGLGIILVFLILLPAMGVTGKNLLSSEAVGVSDEALRPRMREQAQALFKMYLFLTGTLMISLMLLGWTMGGLTPFDAINHAFTTMATGGFSTQNASIGSFQNLPVEVLITVFMFLGGCNFIMLMTTFREGPRGPTSILRQPEFKLYLRITLGMILLVSLSLYLWGGTVIDEQTVNRDYSQFGRCLRDASFQVVSLLTSTGYSTADYQYWPHHILLALLFCMFVGGCTGSTAGGFKMLRLLVSLKLIVYTVHKFIRPKSVERLKVGNDVLPNSTISAILALLLLWLTGVLAGALLISIDERMDLFAAVTTSVSMMSCTGPSMAEVLHRGDELTLVSQVDVGPYGGYGDLPAWMKILMSFQMILGRLEILAPLVLLAPRMWRR